MMNLHTYIPPPPLSHYVNEIWLCEDYLPSHPVERILPGGTMEIVIPLSGEPLRVCYPSNPDQPHTLHGPTVAGARSEYFLVETRSPATVMGIYFKPGAALPFFGTPGTEMHNLHLPLDVLWRAEAEELRCRVLEASTIPQKFRAADAVLCRRLMRSQARHKAVTFALTAFHQNIYTIGQIVDQIGLSPRRFIQVFSEEVGMTPKLFCRIQRFQDVLRVLAKGQPDSWADLALTSGYYDQSHFINDFQSIAGIRPTLYNPPDPEHPTNLAG